MYQLFDDEGDGCGNQDDDNHVYAPCCARNGDIDDDDNHVYVQRCPCCAGYVLDRTLLVPVDRTLIIIFLNSSSSSSYHHFYDKLLKSFFGCIVADQIF